MQPSTINQSKDRKQSKRANVIIYELNEVPWEIVDLYVKKRPNSNLALLLKNSSCLTTVNEDTTPFQPWRTWPTFHKSMYTPEHNSFELGQDPTTFYGENIWDIAEANGLRIGLFGPMQSWPAYQPRNNGFYVPDTFSRSHESFPESMERFQKFNLLMTKQNHFAPDAELDIKETFLTGLSLLKEGITLYSVYNICLSLMKERVNKKFKAGRSILQVLPSFDLYWKLHLKHQPHLSIFFTNHVAGMMHRYWGDGVPGYTESNYKVEKIFSNLIAEAMDRFDHQLGRIMKFISKNPDTLLIVASSMGQGPVPYQHIQEVYVVEDVRRLISKLNLEGAEEGLAMYPSISLKFPEEKNAKAAMSVIQSIINSNSEPMFINFVLQGNTLSFIINFLINPSELSTDISYSSLSTKEPLATGKIDEFGISIKTRPGGGNTAYHIPEGIFIIYGAGTTPDPSRQEVSVLDAAPTILSFLDLPQPKSMKGKPIASLAVAY